MTAGQRKTLKVIGGATVLGLFLCLMLLGWEFHSITLRDQATISETIWVLWAHQPGPIALLLATLAFWAGVFCGHFLWQSAKIYNELRAVRSWDGAGIYPPYSSETNTRQEPLAPDKATQIYVKTGFLPNSSGGQ